LRRLEVFDSCAELINIREEDIPVVGNLSQHFLEIRLALIDYATTHRLDELLTLSLDRVGELVKSPIGFYHFVGSDQKTLLLQQWSTRTLKDFCRAEGKGSHYGVDQAGVWVDCLHQKKAVIHNDYSSLPHKKGMPEGHAKVVRELVVPVFREGKAVAILGVGNKPTDYTQRDVRIVSYFADVTWEIVNQKRIEEFLEKTTYDLHERVKELSCFYSISKLVENDDLTIDGILQGIVDLLPQSWHYPEITCAQIKLIDRSFRTTNFKETEWVQSNEILVNKEHVGFIEVFLIEINPSKYEEPFLVEEQHLLKAIAERIGRIIERKLAHEQLQKSHEELEVRVEEKTKELVTQNLNLLDEIKKRQEAEYEIKIFSEKIKLFAYSVAHDLKNPAISVHGLAKFLNEKLGNNLDDRAKKICKQIQRASEDIVSLVNQINVFISAKETPLDIENISLKEIFIEINDEFVSEFNNRSIQLSVSDNVPDSLVADRISIIRIFRNIIENSLKYGGEELGRITIDYRATDDLHILTVTDDGKGIKEKDSDSIFKWFKRRTDSRGTQGAGMGLAIIREIISLHGGEIWHEPAKPTGVTFCFSIYRHLLPTAGFQKE